MGTTIKAKVVGYRGNWFSFENLTADGNPVNRLLSRLPFIPSRLTNPQHQLKFAENPGWSKGDVVTITVEKAGDTA